MLKWLTSTATQGSADAYKEVEVPTGLVNLSRTAYRIREIQIEWPTLISTATNIIEAALLRKSGGGAMLSLTSQAVIWRDTILRIVATAVGVNDEYAVQRYEYPKDLELVIVEDPLYFQVDSASTGGANAFKIRVGYETRNITETERLALIAASLS